MAVFCSTLYACGAGLPSQTWEWTVPPYSFAARVLHGQAYDQISGHTLLFGGMRSGTTPDGETWTWDGN